MQPGSLIFLVIVAVWAVYLVQHWIRRRDHLATARSADRFSDAMRVLERRASPLVVAGAPATGPYARSSAAAPAPRPAPVRPSLVGRRAPQPGQGSSGSRPVPTAPVRGRGSAAASGLLARRIRGVVVLASLAAVLLTVVLSAATVVGWVSVPVALVAVVVVLAWTRASVSRERAVLRAARVSERRRVRPPRTVATPVPEQSAVVQLVTSPSPVAQHGPAQPESTQQDRAQHELAQQESAQQESAQQESARPVPDALEAGEVSSEPVVYDLMAVDEADRAAVAAAAFAQEWSPVPVPTPTYMLKDSAPRPSAGWDDGWNGQVERGSMVPVPIEVEDDELEQLMAARHRRVVG